MQNEYDVFKSFVIMKNQLIDNKTGIFVYIKLKSTISRTLNKYNKFQKWILFNFEKK